MKKLVKVILSVLLILGMVITPLHGVEVVSAEEVSTEETQANPMRAVWLRPKETSKEQVEANVQKLADVGINTIFLETVFNGFTIFPVEYDATYQNPDYNGFDVLQAYIEACHSRGMQLHAWVESFFIGMQRARSGGPVYKKYKGTDWILTDKEGNDWEDTMYGKMYFLNPANAECREWIVGLYEILVENYDIDGLQLDYVRYPEKTATKDYGWDEKTVNAFIEEKGYDPREVKPNSYEANVFAQYKRNQVTEFVKACSTRLRAIKPDLIMSLSVYPFYADGIQKFMQSAQLWMEEGYGDLLVPMAYYENQVQSLTNQAIIVAGDSPKNTVMGISTQNGFTLESVEKQTQIILDSGAGVSFFEYETFFSAGYADALKNSLLADTQFNIDVDTYKTDVVRDDVEEPGNEEEKPSFLSNMGTEEIILCVVLGVAVIAIIVEVVFLLNNSKKKKRDSE